jgi:hypothetical protein
MVCFLIAVNGELFGIHTDWSWYAWVAAVSEVLAVLAGAYGLYEERPVHRVAADQKTAGPDGP